MHHAARDLPIADAPRRAGQFFSRAGIIIKDKDKFEKLEDRTVELPAATVRELAAQTEVSFVSPEREVRSLGHLSATTGADVARGLINGATSAGLDGTGIGIAFLDSGIDREHKSFLDRNGKRRFVVGLDFTDFDLENPEHDPYGHGTHVASVATGNGRVAANAYLGIAPNASLINLRVLDDTGKGTVTNVLRALERHQTSRQHSQT